MLGDPPLRDPVVSAGGQALGTWGKWFLKLRKLVDSATGTIGAIRLPGQTASLASTPMSTATLAAGLYLVTYYARITRAATTSSSLIVAINWTDVVACTQAGAALTGNTTATTQSGVVLLRIDALTTIRYQTTYASVGATPMLYSLDVSVQALQGPL